MNLVRNKLLFPVMLLVEVDVLSKVDLVMKME